MKIPTFTVFLLLILSFSKAIALPAPDCPIPGADDAKVVDEQKQKDVGATAPPSPPMMPPMAASPMDIHKVSRPVDNSGSSQFDLSYAIFKAKDSSTTKPATQGNDKLGDRPTIIYIGGGPGAPNIPMGRGPKIPDNYNVIRLDERGTGLNANMAVKSYDASFSSRQDADDVKAIIKAQGLKNYVIWGQSYGTVVATKLGADLSRSSDIPKPKSIVLESVFGRALKKLPNGEHEGDQAIASMTDRVWNQLGESEKSGLKSQMSKLSTFGDDSDKMFQSLIVGLPRVMSAEKTASLLAFYAKESPDQLHVQVLTMAASQKPPAGVLIDPAIMAFGIGQYRAIGCNELERDGGNVAPVKLYGGLFEMPSGMAQSCPSCFHGDNRLPFNSQDFQITGIPVHYLEGEDDMATPQWEAKYHFDHQLAHSRDTFDVIPGGTHIPTVQTDGPLDTVNCNKGIIDSAFASDNSSFKQAITSCLNHPPPPNGPTSAPQGSTAK